MTDFNTGLDEFEEKETMEEGLGPVFNGTSCAECHSVPSIGRVGAQRGCGAGDAHRQDIQQAL